MPSASRSCGKRTAPDGDHQLVDLERVLALRIRVGHLDGRAAPPPRAKHLRPELDVEPCLLKWRCASLRDALVRDRQQSVGSASSTVTSLPEPPPDAAELEPDDARADHTEPRRDRVEFQRIPGIDDVFAVVRGRARGGSAPSPRPARRAWPAGSSREPSAAVTSTLIVRAAGAHAPACRRRRRLEQRRDAAGHGS